MHIWIICEKYPNSKKNRPNRTPGEGDIADLKISGVADNLFEAVRFQCRSEHLGARYVESNCRSEFFVKKYPVSKKNQSNRSPDEEDLANLKSAIFQQFLVTVGQLQCA